MIDNVMSGKVLLIVITNFKKSLDFNKLQNVWCL